jgi:hypothetical protein
MPNLEPSILKPTTTKDSDQWVSELSSRIDRLRRRGIGAVLLDLTFPDSGGGKGLRAVARRLHACVRAPDTKSRLSGVVAEGVANLLKVGIPDRVVH